MVKLTYSLKGIIMSIATFTESEVIDAVANVIVTGKTANDKRLSIIATASSATVMFAASMKGKAGIVARESLQRQGTGMMFFAARKGNYKPLAEMLALLGAEPVSISNRESFMSLLDRYQPKLAALLMEDKAFKNDKMTAKATVLDNSIRLIKETYAAVEAIIKQEREDKAERELLLSK